MTQTDSDTLSPIRRHRAERHLKLAMEKVSESWFPVNLELLKKIQAGLTDGRYDLDVDFLVQDLKGDFALLTFCLMKVREDFKLRGDNPQSLKSPLEMLRLVGVDRLKQILLDKNRISPFELADASSVQQLRLKESLISTATAETICEHEEIDPDLGYSTALARQLGLLLIAWNYPHVYRRELTARDPSETLEQALDRALGFSPQLLGSAIAQSCGVDTRDAERKADEVGQSLVKICEIGEALARANSPDHYPSARADWENAQEALEEILGIEPLREVSKKIESNSQSYIAALPAAFRADLALDPERRLQEHLEHQQRRENPYLRSCPPFMRELLEEVYKRMSADEVSREAIQFLTKQAIPGAGFTAGCIYIFDPTQLVLVPRVKIGDPSSSLAPIRYTNTPAARDIINAAFNSQTPLVETGIALQETRVAGLIGEEQRAGVLYLECPAVGQDDRLIDPLLYFKAIRKTLSDCLNLR